MNQGSVSFPIRIGISTCLLGEKVRYDGGHQLDRFLTDTLGPHVQFVPICPEVECGLPVPREAMRLEGDPAHPRLLTRHTRIDHTGQLCAWAEKRVRELEAENLSGCIFKSKSPSCGMERVKIYSDAGGPLKKGVGLFAREFMQHFPLLPVEDEGRLHDPGLRENFIERIFAYQRWQALLGNKTRGGLVDFHTDHKLLVLAHSPDLYRKMGRLVAHAGERHPDESFAVYGELLMEALRLRATPRKNANVLQHLAGYFKQQLSPDEKRELQGVIDQYRRELIPLIVPVTLVNHYIRKYREPYLSRQWYLHPHPIELKLRNHA